MSVDIGWDTITSGPDGEALAEGIRDFVHTKFQQIALPRFINSVHVHSFDFGDVCPDIEIKDVCDPLPDFYEDDEDEEDDSPEPSPLSEAKRRPAATGRVDQEHLQQLQNQILHAEHDGHRSRTTSRSFAQYSAPSTSQPLADPFVDFSRGGTPGIPGGTSNFSYFHLPIGGMPGTHTPLAAVASGTPYSPMLWSGDQHGPRPQTNHQSSRLNTHEGKVHRATTPPVSRHSTANSVASPPDPGHPFNPSSLEAELEARRFEHAEKVSDDLSASSTKPAQTVQPSDLQIVARVKYAGNVKMILTAEILLDYPMPSFVGIPLNLSITGMTFDGVAIIAYIKKRMHFCFLSPEDADALVGDQMPDDACGNNSQRPSAATTGLLQEIHVESEIGRKENGKQVLKNVGKVEKFVLEQVRRIFEEEFVFPSSWTFLI